METSSSTCIADTTQANRAASCEAYTSSHSSAFLLTLPVLDHNNGWCAVDRCRTPLFPTMWLNLWLLWAVKGWTYMFRHTCMWECGTMWRWSSLGYLRADWEFHQFLKRDQHITGTGAGGAGEPGSIFQQYVLICCQKRKILLTLTGCRQHWHTMSSGLASYKMRNILD